MFGSRAASASASLLRRGASTLHVPGISVSVGAGAPTVADVAVNVTFVNYLGERRVLTALEGETLLAVAQRHRYSYVDGACGGGGAPSEKLHKQGEWVEPKYGEGASCYFCHVVVAKAFAHLLPPVRADEEEQLRQYPFKEDTSDTSRLACQISLTKAMDGMLVFVPDGPPSDMV